jgi:6,7-dimethyl-8-ribityllumazine synthase
MIAERGDNRPRSSGGRQKPLANAQRPWFDRAKCRPMPLVALSPEELMSQNKSEPHLLIVEARFYDDMADALLEGATEALKAAGATWDVVTVPGALEIPPAIAMALDASEDDGTHYDGFVALGMVIRGETYHFDIVAGESSRALMDLAVSESLPIGNGILTVENDEQGWRRARRGELDKGGFAARAALMMITLKNKLGA